ncbi:hypothetical protein Tco_0261901 [Tanacetum coccineum]
MMLILMNFERSRPDIMFAIYACSRFQVTPKTSHLHVVKRIFRYLKGKPKLGLWYLNVSSFNLEAYSDSDYVGANLDRKSITRGCQFLGRRLISWQCKKQIIMATSTTEAEYVAAANCCGQFVNAIELGRRVSLYTLNEDLMVTYVPSLVQKAEETLLKMQFELDLRVLNGSIAFGNSQGCSGCAAEILKLRTRLKKLEKKCKPSISHHRAWLRSISVKKKLRKKEYVSKQGRKKAKPGPTLDDSTLDDLDLDLDHSMDYIETEEAVDEGRLSKETEELKLTADTEEIAKDKGSGEKGGSTKELVSTAVPEIVSTTRSDVDAARQEVSVVEPRTPPATTSIFDDEDITMAQTLIKMKEEKAKEKGVAIKEVEESDRPARSILTLKPLPTIDPKDKGKGVLKESPVKKVKRSDLDAAQITKDAEVARLVYEEELAELEREKEEKQRQEQASMDYITNLYDEVQAKMDASEELAARLQMEEREMYSVEERSRLLVEYFENRKKQLAVERLAAVRNKPPTRTQLRSLMMTYLKHTGRYKHAQLNKKTLEEIQVLYIKEQERIAYFVPIGLERDERMIEKLNKKAAGMDEKEALKEPNNTKVEENTRKRPGRRLKMKATKKSKRQKTDSDLEDEEQLKAFLKIVPHEEREIDYEVLDKRGKCQKDDTFSNKTTNENGDIL